MSTSQVIGACNEWLWTIMMAKWYSGTCGPKASWHLSYRWGKTSKKPHPGNLSRPGIEPGPAEWQVCMLAPAPQRWTPSWYLNHRSPAFRSERNLWLGCDRCPSTSRGKSTWSKSRISVVQILTWAQIFILRFNKHTVNPKCQAPAKQRIQGKHCFPWFTRQ